MINQLSLESFQQLTAAAVTDVAQMIRHEHVQHFGRANRVEHRDAKFLLPFFSKLRGQGLTGRYAEAQTFSLKWRNITMMFEQHAINNWYPEKYCRTIIPENVIDNLRRRFLSTENRGQSVEQRKRKAISQPVSKGQTRR